jgi:hypothetical protein
MADEKSTPKKTEDEISGKAYDGRLMLRLVAVSTALQVAGDGFGHFGDFEGGLRCGRSIPGEGGSGPVSDFCILLSRRGLRVRTGWGGG